MVSSLRFIGVAERWALTRIILCFLAAGTLAVALLVPPENALLLVAGLGAVVLTLLFPLIGFCMLAFSVPWGSSLTGSVGSFTFASTDVLVALVGAAWLLSALECRITPIATPIWTGYVLLFVAAIAVSATQAADTNASLRELVKWIELLVVFEAGSWFVRSRNDMIILAVAIVAAGVSQAILGYIQFAFQLGPAAFIHGSFLRAYGTFDQPNPYAGYLNMALPLAIAMAILSRSALHRFWWGLSAITLGGALLASESRGALLAGLLAVVVVLACIWRGAYRLVWVGALTTAIGAWFASLGLISIAPFQRLLDAIGLGNVSFGHVTDANFSAVERAAHWLAGVRMFADHPLLGVGIGNYAVAYPAYHPRGWYPPLAHAHNYYINIAAEAGILGLVAYLLMIGSALWYSYAAIRRSGDALRFAVALGALGALIATGFHNLFDVLYVHGMVVLLGLLMVLVAASNTPPNPTRAEAIRRGQST